MPNLLEKTYPHLPFISMVCIRCCGHPMERYGLPRCKFCKKFRHQWIAAGFEQHTDELIYLWRTWQKCRDFQQITTGIDEIDFLIIYLWDKPWPYFRVPQQIRTAMEHRKTAS